MNPGWVVFVTSMHRIVQLSCCLQIKSVLEMAFGPTSYSWQQLGTHSLYS